MCLVSRMATISTAVPAKGSIRRKLQSLSIEQVLAREREHMSKTENSANGFYMLEVTGRKCFGRNDAYKEVVHNLLSVGSAYEYHDRYNNHRDYN